MTDTLDTKVRAFLREHNIVTASAWGDLHDLIAEGCAPLYKQIHVAKEEGYRKGIEAAAKVCDEEHDRCFRQQHAVDKSAAQLAEMIRALFQTEARAETGEGLRKCEQCKGNGPCLHDNRDGRYKCASCHSEPNDPFHAHPVDTQ